MGGQRQVSSATLMTILRMAAGAPEFVRKVVVKVKV